MIRNAKLFLVCLLLVATLTVPVSSARLPAVGDHVRICTAGSIAPLSYEGTITEIGNGFVDLMCKGLFFGVPEEDSNYGKIAEFDPPKDLCIGIGAIIRLEWI